MSTTTAPKGGPAMKQTERIEAPMGGPGRGPMGGGMVGQKAMTFGPSAQRMLRRMAP
jgi:ATP-binding cassette subfamily B protein